MIQVLMHSGKNDNFVGKNTVINSFHDAQSLDEFETNVINLQDENIWRNREKNTTSINLINDFKSLSTMIENSKKSNIVILFPQNVKYIYYTKTSKEYWIYEELKNMLINLKDYILVKLYAPIEFLDVVYENTKTKIENIEIPASFYFNGIAENILTRSIRSNKPTTIGFVDVIMSTLNVNSYNELIAFLRVVGLISEKQSLPDWAKEVIMFDDEKQLEIIHENELIIQQLEKKIDEAQSVLEKNQKYKSILYTTGDELVDGVFEILEEMMGCQLSDFKDDKKEDFRFTIDEKVFIGEIKGVTPNVKKANVSQVDVHVQEYLDEHEEHRGHIVSLLIINHQRNKALSDREPIPDEQIRLAERNDSLIVETVMLLKLFEKYLSGEKSREECISVLADAKGVLIV